uniref:(northern house mosquito) hypothetical protein n=1 Tax=Culex pipiens TaxID=7175 RepID=A0A8D8K0K0_CULPI
MDIISAAGAVAEATWPPHPGKSFVSCVLHLKKPSLILLGRMMLHRRRRRRRRARTGTVHEVPRMPNSPTRPEHQLDVVHLTIRILPSCVRSCSSDAEQATVRDTC